MTTLTPANEKKETGSPLLRVTKMKWQQETEQVRASGERKTSGGMAKYGVWLNYRAWRQRICLLLPGEKAKQAMLACYLFLIFSKLTF